jgi:hypothetical protein
MLYQYMRHTTRNRKGERVELDPAAIQTGELLRGGFIVPVAQPKAAARETKVVEPEETKQRKRRKVKPDDSTDA